MGKISLLINGKRRVAIGGTELFRPVQYIGSKIKLAESIASHICSSESSGVVLDPFSGTGVMGQEFARRGWKVISSDALNFCNIMARATLGIGKKTDDKLEQEWNSVQKVAENIATPKKWTDEFKDMTQSELRDWGKKNNDNRKMNLKESIGPVNPNVNQMIS